MGEAIDWDPVRLLCVFTLPPSGLAWHSLRAWTGKVEVMGSGVALSGKGDPAIRRTCGENSNVKTELLQPRKIGVPLSPISVISQGSHPPALMRYRKANKILLKAAGMGTKNHKFYDNHLGHIVISFWDICQGAEIWLQTNWSRIWAGRLQLCISALLVCEPSQNLDGRF